MANNVDELVQELYKEFRGLPNTNAIVRNNTIKIILEFAIVIKFLKKSDILIIDAEPLP